MSATVPDSLVTLNDHLARLLAHADRLLREWQAHADGVRGKLDAEAHNAGEVLHKALEEALTDVSTAASVQLQRSLGSHAEGLLASMQRAQQAAKELESHLGRVRPGKSSDGGRPRDRLILVLALSANVLLVVLLAVTFLRKTPTVTSAPPREAVVSQATVDAAPPEPPDAAPLPTGACAGLAISGWPSPAKLVSACAATLCPGAKPGSTLSVILKGCAPEDETAKALVALLRPLEKDAKALDAECKQVLAPDRDGSYTVTADWLKTCVKQP